MSVSRPKKAAKNSALTQGQLLSALLHFFISLETLVEFLNERVKEMTGQHRSPFLATLLKKRANPRRNPGQKDSVVLAVRLKNSTSVFRFDQNPERRG